MKNVLVTGGAGFIGSNFVCYLLEVDTQIMIVNLDALTYAGSLENLANLPDPDRHKFIKGNICDKDLVNRLFKEFEIDTVVHFAAESHVDRSILGPEQFIQTNIVGTFSLLEAARDNWKIGNHQYENQMRFHHVSTDEVYGTLGPGDPPFSETTPYSPNSPYAASKASSDHLVRSYYHTYGLPVTISNCSNNYGPYQFPEKLIPLMILNALQGKPLPIYGDGKQIRDWLYVGDHCEAIYQVLLNGKSGETYNIGGDNQPTNLEIVENICTLLDRRVPDSPYIPHIDLLCHVKDRLGHDRRYAMETKKIKESLGWKPKELLQTGLEKTVDWYLEHPKWVSEITMNKEFESWLEKNYQKRGE